jgi:hypothetical protein
VRSDAKDRLAHVLWLGGSSCAGKSSIARLLAPRHGLTIYHCDDHFDEHARRLDPSRQPYFWGIKDLSPEQLWMRPLEVQVAELSSFYEEEFDMVVDDLLSLGPSAPALVEGAGLAPRNVVGLLRHPRQALWLVTSPEFRRREYPRRGGFVSELLAQCSDPTTAFDNWMKRDEERARLLKADLTDMSLPFLEVDGRRTVAEMAELVMRHFDLGGGGTSA